jgi:acetyl esterase/lipase
LCICEEFRRSSLPVPTIKTHSMITKLLIPAVMMLSGLTSTGQGLGPRDVDGLPVTQPTAVLKYGSGPLESGQLRVPEGDGPFPVAIIIHGGCWTKGFATMRNTAPAASELAKKGVATWNIEYRQVGDVGGGWPGTFQDWAAAADYVRVLAKSYPLDLSRLVVIGHSAGAHAALWVAARPKLSATSDIRGADPISVKAAVAIDGSGDLEGSIELAARWCRKHVVEALMGGSPQERPERYPQGSPQSLLPFGVRQFLVSAAALPLQDAQEYQTIAQAGGDYVEILSVPDSGHFEVIAPGRAQWQAVEELILERAIPKNPTKERPVTAPGLGPIKDKVRDKVRD